MTSKKITRPPLRYAGGKFRIRTWVLSHFPAHDCYVEPFGGGGSIILSKPRATFEVYNDLDGEVVNFFRVLRERPDELIQAIQLTPWSREEQRTSFRPTKDPLERARRLYVRAWQTHGGPRTQWKSGWRCWRDRKSAGNKDAVASWDETDHLWAAVERLKRVQIENDDAISVIQRFDTPRTLFYIDPPYLLETRSKSWRGKTYQHELTPDDHRALAEVLSDIEGMAIVSGYPSPVYDELYAGWRTETTTTNVDHKGGSVTEKLWISPHVPLLQLRLFG